MIDMEMLGVKDDARDLRLRLALAGPILCNAHFTYRALNQQIPAIFYFESYYLAGW